MSSLLRSSHCVSGLATAALVSALGLWSAAGAAEFHFVVQEVGEKQRWDKTVEWEKFFREE